MAVKKAIKKKTRKPGSPIAARKGKPEIASARLLGDIRRLIDEARMQVARAVNAGTVMLYWHIGSRIRSEILQFKRAEYGEEIVQTLSGQLMAEYGRGFSEQSLRHMIRFAEVFPDEEILSALRREFGWTHFKRLIYRISFSSGGR